MIVYYSMIAASAVMFGFQFFFNRFYQRNEGTGFSKSLVLCGGSSIVGAVMMLAVSGFKIQIPSLFALAMISASALVGISMLYFSSLALEKVSLSLYSLFAMLGGMLLPFLAGILFFEEGNSIAKILCVVAIAAALFLTLDKGVSLKGIGLCMAVFVVNGLNGVVAKFHEESAASTTSENFMLWKCLISVVICLVLFLFVGGFPKLSKPKGAVLAMIGFSAMNVIPNLLVLIALSNGVEASVQYPMITGGTIIVSTVISVFTGEKLTLKSVIAALVALAASILIIF